MKISKIFLQLLVTWIAVPFIAITYILLRRRSFNTRFKAIYFLSFLIFRFYGKGRERVKKNISLIHPHLNDKQIDEGCWRVIKTTARSWAAMMGNEFLSAEEIAKKKYEVSGLEELLNCYRRGEKIIATMDHVGAVDEMLGIASILQPEGVRLYVPIELIRPRFLFKIMQRSRLRFGDFLVFEPVEKGKTLTRAAQYMSQGRIVLLLVDAVKSDQGGVSCRLGGAQARFPVGAIKLALEQNATLFPMLPSSRPEDKWRIRFVICPPFQLIKTGDLNHDIEINTRRLIEEVHAPHIQQNWDNWLRLVWCELEPAKSSSQQPQIT